MKLSNVLILSMCVLAIAAHAMDVNYAQQLKEAVAKKSTQGDKDFQAILESIPQDFKASGSDQKLLPLDVVRYLSRDLYKAQTYQLLQHRLLDGSVENLLETVFYLYAGQAARWNLATFRMIIDFLPTIPAENSEYRKEVLRKIARSAASGGEHDVLYTILEKNSADIVVDIPDAAPDVARTTEWTALNWLDTLWKFSHDFPALLEHTKNRARSAELEYVYCLTFLVDRADAIDPSMAEEFFDYFLPKADSKDAVYTLMPLMSAVARKLNYDAGSYTGHLHILVPVAWYQHAPLAFFALLVKTRLLSEQELKRGFFLVLKRNNSKDSMDVIRLLLAELPDSNELPASNKPVSYLPEKQGEKYDWQQERGMLMNSFFDEISSALAGKGEKFIALYVRKFPMLATQTNIVDGVAVTPLDYIKNISPTMAVDQKIADKVIQLLKNPELQKSDSEASLHELDVSSTDLEVPVKNVAQGPASTWKEWCAQTKSVVAQKTICYAVLRTAALTAAVKRAYNQWRSGTQRMGTNVPLVWIKNSTQKEIIISGSYTNGVPMDFDMSAPGVAKMRLLDTVAELSVRVDGEESPFPVINVQEYKKARHALYADLYITVRPTNRFERWWYKIPYTYGARWIRSKQPNR